MTTHLDLHCRYRWHHAAAPVHHRTEDPRSAYRHTFDHEMCRPGQGHSIPEDVRFVDHGKQHTKRSRRWAATAVAGN
jgi:hypothetical protein